MEYPKISIVTACYNMEKYIELTIQSVLNQNYPNLEYIVVDGASKDGTMDIINKYKDRISLIISEPDNGMYDAIQKGFSHATGDIYAWLNADDTYMPWTFETVAKLFSEHPDVDWAIGQTAFMVNERQLNKIYNFNCAYKRKHIAKGWHREGVLGCIQQESCFWRKELWDKVGGLDTSMRLAGDFDLWVRFAEYSELTTIALPLAAFYIRNDSLSREETSKKKYLAEVNTVCQRVNSGYPSVLYKWFGQNLVMNRLLRLMTWAKTDLYAYSLSRNEWVLKRICRPVSNTSFSYLWLENRLK